MYGFKRNPYTSRVVKTKKLKPTSSYEFLEEESRIKS